jgi:hypothetical protein
VDQSVVPEFEPQYHKKRKKEKEKIHHKKRLVEWIKV